MLVFPKCHAAELGVGWVEALSTAYKYGRWKSLRVFCCSLGYLLPPHFIYGVCWKCGVVGINMWFQRMWRFLVRKAINACMGILVVAETYLTT